MPYDSRDIAAYIAQQCNERGLEYNNTKIQKLLYCCYGTMLAWRGKRICNEYPHAWQYGPVFPKVLNYYTKYKDIAPYSDRIAREQSDEKTDVVAVVDNVLAVFGKMSASYLSTWSHQPGSPWDIVVNGNDNIEGAGLNSFMPDDFIRDYFKEKVLDNAY